MSIETDEKFVNYSMDILTTFNFSFWTSILSGEVL